MRVIVTGATGFVGANLVRRLLRDGHEVHLLVRKERQNWRIEEIQGAVRMHEVDIAHRAQIRETVQAIRPNWVFHLAAYGAYSYQTEVERILATNTAGSIALLDACAEIGVEAFIHTGSSSEYGLKGHGAREDDLLEPNSAYAVSKAAATHYGQFLARKQNLNAITVRLYSIYGPYEEPTRLVPTLLIHGLNSGWPPLVSPRTARDFVYVDDAVDGMIRIAGLSGLRPGSVYNLCSGVQTDLATVVAHTRSLLRIAAEPVWASMESRSWDTDIWVGDPSKTLQETGWRTETSLTDGLERTLKWLAENPARRAFYAARVLK